MTQILLNSPNLTGISVKEPNVIINVKPDTPTNLSYIIQGNDVIINCDVVASANKYDFYRDTVYKSTETNPQWIDANITNGTYLYSIVAINEFAPINYQYSNFSSDLSVTIDNSRITSALSVSEVTQTSFQTNVSFSESCKLRTYVSTTNPPTDLKLFENSLTYSSHIGRITGLTANTTYYIQVEAEFSTGNTEKSDVVTQQTLTEVVVEPVVTVLDVAASQASFKLKNSSGAIVSQITPGNIYTIEVDWVDSFGNYAGTGNTINMDVNIGSEVFNNRITGTNTNKYTYTAPSTNTVLQNVIFTWGKFDDNTLTTKQSASKTYQITIADNTGTDLTGFTNLPIVTGIPYGGFTDTDWANMLGVSKNWVIHNNNISTREIDNRNAHIHKLTPKTFSSSSTSGSDRVAGSFDISPSSEITLVQWIRPDLTYAMGQQEQLGRWGFSVAGGTAPSTGAKKSDGFSVRLAPIGDKILPDTSSKIYLKAAIYAANMVNTASADELGLVNPNTSSAYVLPRGQWTEVSIYVKTNTSASVSNGILKVSINGVVMLERTNIQWMSTGSPHIDLIEVDSFHGGNGLSAPSKTNEIAFSNLYVKIVALANSSPVHTSQNDVLTGSTHTVRWTDTNRPAIRNYDQEVNGVDQGASEVNTTSKVVTVPTDGSIATIKTYYWDNGVIPSTIPFISYSIQTANLNNTNLAGYTKVVMPANDIGYGSFSNDSLGSLFSPANKWYLNGGENVSVSTIEGEKLLVARMSPILSGSSGSNQIKSGIYLPSLVTGSTPVKVAFDMRLRSGFSYGISNNKQTAKLGIGLRSLVDSSGGLPKADGWSIRPVMRGNGDGTANLNIYPYTAASTSGYPADISTGFQLSINTWISVIIEVAMNSTGNSNGILRVWINGTKYVDRTNIYYQSSGTPNIAGMSFTNFFGGDSPEWRPANTSYAEFRNIGWKVG